LSGYLALADNLNKSGKNHGNAYNFGPSSDQNYSVRGLIDEMAKYWDRIKWNDVSEGEEHVYEAGLLKLNCDKALFDLEWHSALQFEKTVEMTVEWYRHYYQNKGESMYSYTIGQIKQYTKIAKLRKIPWACND